MVVESSVGFQRRIAHSYCGWVLTSFVGRQLGNQIMAVQDNEGQLGMVTYIFNPSTWGEEAGKSLSLRLVWSI